MAHWQDRFLGIGELPPELSVFEIEFFQFSPHDIAAIRKEFRPKYRIAVALQLGFMRLTGAKLNAFNVVPRKLLNLVGEQVREDAPSIASLRSMYRRGNTRRDHQAWVMQWLDIKVHTKRQERMLFAALREASKAIGSIDRLIATARQWLFDKSLLVPATSTLRDLCVRAASDTESQIYQCICRAVLPEKQRGRRRYSRNAKTARRTSSGCRLRPNGDLRRVFAICSTKLSISPHWGSLTSSSAMFLWSV